ncbi:MAG: hypothetical protein ABFR62_12280, partial [Bacteroidota bacterium]
LVAGYLLLVTCCWLLVAGYLLLVTCCWLLVAGCRLLVAGCWLTRPKKVYRLQIEQTLDQAKDGSFGL